MNSKRLAQFCYYYADNRKAENPVILDVRAISSVADFFVLLSAGNQPHLKAIVDAIRENLKKEHGLQPRSVEGTRAAAWIVVDYNDVLVHVMTPETRERYDLEGLWGDAPKLKPRKPPQRRKTTGATV